VVLAVMGNKSGKAAQAALMTQEELSMKSGGGEATISRIESGHQTPTYSTIKKLAVALSVDPKILLKQGA